VTFVFVVVAVVVFFVFVFLIWKLGSQCEYILKFSNCIQKEDQTGATAKP